MKKKLILVLLIVSLGINLFLLGDRLLFQPTEEEEIVLSEMVQKTVESADYQEIPSKEKVVAINRFLEKAKGGTFPYNFTVNVYTDTQTHIFACTDAACSAMESTGTMYSIYQDEAPRLPFDQ